MLAVVKKARYFFGVEVVYCTYGAMKIQGSIYMVGIGGIGMSALAQLFVHQGRKVSGSDRDESPVVTMLVQKGIAVTVGHDQCNIPADCELLV